MDGLPGRSRRPRGPGRDRARAKEYSQKTLDLLRGKGGGGEGEAIPSPQRHQSPRRRRTPSPRGRSPGTVFGDPSGPPPRLTSAGRPAKRQGARRDCRPSPVFLPDEAVRVRVVRTASPLSLASDILREGPSGVEVTAGSLDEELTRVHPLRSAAGDTVRGQQFVLLHYFAASAPFVTNPVTRSVGSARG